VFSQEDKLIRQIKVHRAVPLAPIVIGLEVKIAIEKLKKESTRSHYIPVELIKMFLNETI
jgi:hypothetical protein